MQSPLDIILNTAKRIAGEGKKAVLNTNVGRGAQFVAKQTKDLVRGTGAFNEQTNLGIARNTITGLPKAAKDTFFPTRGYTEAELSQAKPTLKETALAIPKVFTEIGTSVSTLTDMIPGVKGLADRAIKSKAGDYLAQQGQKLQKFAQPETAGQAKAMRFADVAGFLPVGSVKNIGTAARSISALKDATAIAKELKAIGVADNVITGLSKELVDATDEVAISKRLTESMKPKEALSLEQEAKKYKSAEEFVKAQGIPVYHGSDKLFTSTDEIKFGDDVFYTLKRTDGELKELAESASPDNYWSYDDLAKMPANAFGKEVSEFIVNFKNPKIVDAKGKGWMELTDGSMSDWTNKIVQQATKSGKKYDGIIIKNIEEGFSAEGTLGASAGLVDDYIVLNKSAIKTKSQLEEIWNKAIKKPVTEAALDRDIAQTKVETPRISEVDRLIAQGDIRIKQKDGMERYEYKSKDGTFKLAPTDEDAVLRVKQIQAQKQATKAQKKKFVVPDILANKMVDVQIKKDALANDPLNTLTKFVNKKTGELPEVTGTGKSTFARKGDNIVDEIYGGTKTSEDVRSEIPYFMERKRELKAQEKEITREIAKLKKSEREKGTILRQLEKEADDVVRSRENAQKMPKQKDIQTLEEMAAQQSGTVVDNYLDKWASLPSSIKIKQTPVQKKIAFYDYIRTPIEVLKKIGLEKQGRLLIQKQDDYMQELPKNIEKITKWIARAPGAEASKRIFQYLDGKEITLQGEELKVANEIKVWLAEWADRLKLPEDNRIASYITHLFDDQLIQKEFDEDLAKIIEDKIPGEVYNPFLEKRLGAKGYIQDAWKALDAYVKRATRKVHMDEALEELEIASGTLEKSQFNYVKRFANNVNMRPTELEETFDNAIKQLIGYKEGQRPTIKILGTARQMVARGAFGLNLGTAMRNLSQGANTYAKLGEKYTVLGYAKLFSKKNMQEVIDSGVLGVGFIQDRVLSSRKQALQKIDKGLFFFLDMAERANRGAAYLGAKAKAIDMGKTEAEAIRYAKDIVSETQFRFGAVDTPVALNSAILKTLTQFQSYTVKQTEFLANMLKNKEYAGLIRYAGAGLTFVYTIGQLFGMKPEELVPMFRFEAPPIFKGPWELGKAVLDTPDKYGQPRDLAQKAEDVMKPFALFIPASTQAQKTYKGINANIEGGSYTKDGKLQFESGKTTAQKVQNVLFGKYASPEAKAYFKRLEATEDANAEMENVYNYIQELKKNGNEQEALQIFNDLSDEEKAIYKNVKSEKTKQENADGKRAVMPAFVEIRTLKDSGKAQEAIEAYNALSEEEKKYYQLLKKDHDALEKKLKAEEKVSAERNLVENIFAYAKALVVDPGQAWMALTTDEVLGDVRWTDVTLKRFMGKYFTEQGGSEEYVKKELEKMGIPYSDRSKYNLEHIIPVAAGGSNQPENLALIPRDLHDSYTEFDIALSKAVQSNKLSRKQAAQIAIKFKSGNMTKEEALQAIK